MKQGEFEGLKNGSYFYITNRQTKQALTYDTDAPSPHLHFAPLDLSCPDQIWMIEQVQQNRYEIVHACSTLVLTSNKKSSKLSIGNQSSNQLFFVQKSNPKQNPIEYWIRESKTSQNYLFFDVALKCSIVNEKTSKARWEFQRINNNNELLKSCLIQFAYSGLFLDLPGSSIKHGVAICQYDLNARCNQRWKVLQIRNSGFYVIISVRSKMCLTIKGNKEKPGTDIIQEPLENSNDGQLWKLHHQGRSLYIIQSKLKEDLFLGVKNNSMNGGQGIVSTNQQQYAFWRILGQIQKS